MPAEAGFHGFLYWEIAMSKPSRERSTLASPSRTQAREPRNVSAHQRCILPVCGIRSDSGLWLTMGPSKASPVAAPV